MTVQQDRLQSQLEQLQQQFSASLPARVEQIVVLLLALHESFDEANFQLLRTEVHQLAGSVSAFGYQELNTQIVELASNIKSGRCFFLSLSGKDIAQCCNRLRASIKTRERLSE